MRDHAIDEAANLLAAARRALKPFDGLPDTSRPTGEAAAYLVQDRLHEKLRATGQGAIIAHKIGCTTEVMQRYLGIHNPCAGGIFENTIHRGEGHCRHGDFVRVGVECEIAVRLGADMSPDGCVKEQENVAAAVDACMSAIEIVDDRYVDYKTLDTPTLIADDFFNAGAVLGPPVEDWQGYDLAGLVGRMRINGRDVGEGRGADILGHPLKALAWLANALNARGHSLRSGEIVLLGSVVQTHWLDPGDAVEVEIEGLGKASAVFT